MQDLAPQPFGGNARFSVLRRLGEGGTGVVYEAFDTERRSRVALKHLRMWDADMLLRFKNEFRQLQAIDHPGLVKLGELFEESGQWFFTMELVEGFDLLTHLAPHAPHPPERTAEPEDPTIDVATRHLSGRAAAPVTPTQADTHLVTVFAQLAEGLAAIHERGKVHRDIKPANVLVTSEGRVVILDFGLVTDARTKDAVLPNDSIVGTIRYMAPEQALGLTVGPAADWYAFGVILFRALTGRFPIDGPPMEVMQRKQYVDAVGPSTYVPSVPEALDSLCLDLLRIDPETRPTGAEVLRRLRASGTQRSEKRSHDEMALVGREEELALLERAFADAAAGRCVVQYVHGESGLGKSALVRAFADDLVKRGDALVLQGRCYERESVPYKAFDGVVDALSLHLGTLDDGHVEALMPPGAALLTQIFPVLRRVSVLAERAGPSATSDSRELRARVFTALRALLENLAREKPVVLVIDDLQWADRDSHALFESVFQLDPLPRVLVVATMRASSEIVPRKAAREAASVRLESRHLHLEALDLRCSTALAKALLEARGGDASQAETIAREAGGHPMFVSELVRRADFDEQVERLDDALRARIAALDSAARRIVEALSVAGAPLTADAVAHAVTLDLSVFFGLVDALRADHLVRTSGARRTDHVEPYHDRVRAAVTSHLGKDATREWHARLAVAIEAHDAVAFERLAVHWHGAGYRERAAGYATRAAAQAEQALAFDHAADLYKMAISLGPTGPEELVRLKTRLGHSLVNAGRGVESANVFLETAPLATASEALSLEQLAAGQLMMSGHLDQGMDILRRVGRTVKLRLPESVPRKLASLALHRTRLKLRGYEFEPVLASSVDPRELERLDTEWSIVRGLSMIDLLGGAELLARHLLRALDVGEPQRAIRALSMEAVALSSRGAGSEGRVDELLAMIDQKLPHFSHLDGRVKAAGPMTHGAVDYLRGRFPSAIDHLATTERMLEEECTGVAWPLATTRVYLVGCLYLSGRLDELVTRVARYVVDARARGDSYALHHFLAGTMTMASLARGDVEAAERSVEEARGLWPRDHVRMPYFFEVQSRCSILLHRGDAAGAYALGHEGSTALKRALVLHAQYPRASLRGLLGRAALALAAKEPKRAPRLINEARGHAKALRAENAPWLRGLASLLDGGAAAMEGNEPHASAALRAAIEELDASAMELHASAARHALAARVSGGERDALVQRSTDYFGREGVTDIAHIADHLVPGIFRQA